MGQPTLFPPECPDGNVEYKRMIIDPSPHRLEHLVTQMTYRLDQGGGIALYKIGVNDNGSVADISDCQLCSSLEVLSEMARRVDAKTYIRHYRGINVIEVTIFRDWSDSTDKPEFRVAVLGKCNSGKSTLVGVLREGVLDDGRGLARVSLMSHYHELDSGMTSTTSGVMLGFKGDKIVRRSLNTELFRDSDRLVAFLDLAGNERYLRTAMGGLTGNHPDLGVVVTSVDEGSGLPLETHLLLLMEFSLPILVILNKVDQLSPADLERQTQSLIHRINRVTSRRVRVVCAVRDIPSSFEPDCVPLIPLSLSQGSTIDVVTAYLGWLESSPSGGDESDCEFRIIKIFSTTGDAIVGGTVNRGVVTVGQRLLLGPDDWGKFQPVTVGSLHRWKIPCSRLNAVKSRVSIAIIPDVECQLRAGQVMVAHRGLVLSGLKLIGRVSPVGETAQLREGGVSTMFMGGIRQIVLLERLVESSDMGDVFVIRFCNYYEAFHIGDKFIIFDVCHCAHGVVLDSCD